MYVDLLTLYHLAIGTLLVSAGMMFWEHRSNPGRSKSLRILATGFTTLAIGCTAVLFRRDFPGALASALSNSIVLGGYLIVFNGVASLSGRQYRAVSAGLLGLNALAWIIWGSESREAVWSYVSAVPIALASAMTAWAMLRCDPMKSLNARRIVVVVTSVHAMLYAGRAFLLPWLVTTYGSAIHAIASKITIYEGVLYSVILPMALLKLVRDETHGALLRESQTDYLTRLGNRRWFFEEGQRLIQRRKNGEAIAILAFDLDQFKAINDRYGHHMGDKVLKTFADIAGRTLGPGAILARIGGEEFAAAMSGQDAVRAEALGSAIATAFAQTIPTAVDSIGIAATVSIGMARFEGEVPPLAEALAAADRALYQAKALGGNRLESSSGAVRAATE